MKKALLAATVLLPTAAAAADFNSIVKTWFDQSVELSPVYATALGLHAGDGKLDDVSAAAIAKQEAELHATLNDLAKVDASKLTPMQRDDRDILTAAIGGQLLEDEHVQQWRHNPDTYVGLATTAAYSLIERNFAPAPDRMRAVIARERQMPAMFAVAQKNLAGIPVPYLEIGQEDLAGAIDFLTHDVPKAFKGVADKGLQADLAASTKAAVEAAKGFQAFLAAQKAAAHPSFAYGEANYRAMMASDMIDVSPDQVLAAGRAQLAKDRAAFLEASKQIDPKHPDHALKDIEADHPDGAHLISTAHDQLASIRAFVVSHKIIDLPGKDLPKVAETPEFQRASVFGEMDPPGPFERNATLAYYYITPPDPAESAAKQDEYLSYFNRPLLLNLSVHEVMPGHFVQYLYMRANPGWSLVRKTAHSYTATEGWAHYTEQLMVEQGLSGGDPKAHLAQLQDALLRDCRLVDSVSMHTKGMSLADATKLMADECLQPPQVAYKEARRGTSDPGYFSYTLGKLMILKLRADAQAKEGKAFTLAHFHDRFQNAGLVPLKIIRREIMGTDGPLL
jgi:uncharacterized protein (DUF885 family)